MTLPEDASLLSALETQHQQLDYALARLESARASQLPPPSVVWRGAARIAYDCALGGLGATFEAACMAVRSARDRTRWAIEEVAGRG